VTDWGRPEVLFSLVAAAALALVGCAGLWNIRQMTRHWPAETGHVIGSDIEQLQHTESETWMLILRVRLPHGVVTPKALTFGSLADVERGRLSYPIGAAITLWRDSRHEVYFIDLPLANENPFWPFVFAALFLGFAALGHLGLLPGLIDEARRWLGPILPSSPG
jgi:hypothetical protein